LGVVSEVNREEVWQVDRRIAGDCYALCTESQKPGPVGVVVTIATVGLGGPVVSAINRTNAQPYCDKSDGLAMAVLRDECSAGRQGSCLTIQAIAQQRSAAIQAQAIQSAAVTQAWAIQNAAAIQAQATRDAAESQAIQASQPVRTNCTAFGSNLSCTSQ